MRILIAEDEKQTARALKIMLERSRYCVDIVSYYLVTGKDYKALSTELAKVYIENVTTTELTDYVTWKADEEAFSKYGLSRPVMTIDVTGRVSDENLDEDDDDSSKDDNVYKLDDKKLEFDDVTTAIDDLTINQFKEESPEKDQELALTISVENEDSEETTKLNAKIYKYDGDNCLVVLNEESLGLMDRSLMVDLKEALQNILLDQ